MKSILSLLSGGGFISGELMSRNLGITRAAVWKQIKALREDGWAIESAGKLGYRLAEQDRIDPALWQGQLTTREIGRCNVMYAYELPSTNMVVKKMAMEGAPSGSLSLCERQTAGRGRLGRHWESRPGAGLWQSVLIRPSLRPEQAPLITFAAALAMSETIQKTCGLSVMIKWPNDLVCKGRKICGILLELSADPDRIEYVVIGVGLNVRREAVPEDLRTQAAGIEDFIDPPLRRHILLCYLSELEKTLDVLTEKGFYGISQEYIKKSATIGQPVRICGHETWTGVAENVDDTGALLVRDEQGELRRVLSGDVSVRGVMGYV